MSEAIDKLIQWGVTKDRDKAGVVLSGSVVLCISEPIGNSDWPTGREAAKERITAALVKRLAQIAADDPKVGDAWTIIRRQKSMLRVTGQAKQITELAAEDSVTGEASCFDENN